jgi:hypothetical protein
VVTVQNNLHNIVDFGATLGGYIVKDKLWFFVGVQPSFQRYSWTRSFNTARLDADGNPQPDPATGNIIYDPIANSDQRRFSDEKSINFIGKLTSSPARTTGSASRSPVHDHRRWRRLVPQPPPGGSPVRATA